MKIETLYVYPIKSLQGIKVRQATVLEKGFEHDRRWMLVDEYGVFITQRKHPVLSKINVALNINNIVVSCTDTDKISVPLELQSGELMKVTVWGSTVNAIKASDKINNWFSDAIGLKCSLVFMPNDASRLISNENKANVSFADGYPYLILGQSSMNDLNRRMKAPLPIQRFRPNIVFSDGLPYEEDLWGKFTVGEINFLGINPCVRCVFTTIDQETGESGKEPLKTLSTYRDYGNGVVFGLNTIAKSYGEIKVGDTIVIKSVRK
ncbi:MAG: MOSC N-terminal beta barrel domain-containing protein [Cyclobacteriaceae bacterium]|nr:MOSC N-terminal beta barrel domain-containing protein [Cyclobacteriaceae bacterium]